VSWGLQSLAAGYQRDLAYWSGVCSGLGPWGFRNCSALWLCLFLVHTEDPAASRHSAAMGVGNESHCFCGATFWCIFGMFRLPSTSVSLSLFSVPSREDSQGCPPGYGVGRRGGRAQWAWQQFGELSTHPRLRVFPGLCIYKVAQMRHDDSQNGPAGGFQITHVCVHLCTCVHCVCFCVSGACASAW
jgi:hypothetical protein